MKGIKQISENKLEQWTKFERIVSNKVAFAIHHNCKLHQISWKILFKRRAIAATSPATVWRVWSTQDSVGDILQVTGCRLIKIMKQNSYAQLFKILLDFYGTKMHYSINRSPPLIVKFNLDSYTLLEVPLQYYHLIYPKLPQIFRPICINLWSISCVLHVKLISSSFIWLL